MSAVVSYCILIVMAGLIAALAACAPTVLSDKNDFMRAFVSHGLLDVLGVILAITLASAGNLHLALNQIEERHGKRVFDHTRSRVRMAANFLIALFVVAAVLALVKPALATTDWSQTIFNGSALLVLLWNVLLLISLTQGVFAIRAEIKGPNQTNP